MKAKGNGMIFAVILITEPRKLHNSPSPRKLSPSENNYPFLPSLSKYAYLFSY